MTSDPRKRLSLGIAALILAAAAASWAPPANADSSPTPGPDKLLSLSGGEQVKGRYIVTLNDSATQVSAASAQKLAGKYGGKAHRIYNRVLRGFSAEMSEAKARRLAADPQVEYVEPVQIGHLSGTQPNPPSWGLDRIDQKALPLDNSYTYNTTASNVTAYVVDTGIRTSHQDFGGRATSGKDFIYNDTNAGDCNGHGTHVAGTIGGSAYGVAKGVKLVSVRIFNCINDSPTDLVVSAVEWVTQNAAKPAVANMSARFGSSVPSLETAIKNSIASGVVWTLSANNQSEDACNSSPAKLPEAITVGNTTSSDRRNQDPYYSYVGSNYGPCLDIWAPGTDIKSADYQSDTGYAIKTGTSMAAPHAAGAAALYLAGHPNATAQQTRDALIAQATTVTIGDAKAGSPNKLLNINPSGATCAGYETSRTGSLTSGGWAYQPDGSYFYAAAGTHRACLSGPSGSNFSLSLWQWNGSAWQTVATGGAGGTLAYTGSSGYYSYQVRSIWGSGSYTLGYDIP
ncbi:S8 family peptidase [Streptomyces sp. NPDC002402]